MSLCQGPVPPPAALPVLSPSPSLFAVTQGHGDIGRGHRTACSPQPSPGFPGTVAALRWLPVTFAGVGTVTAAREVEAMLLRSRPRGHRGVPVAVTAGAGLSQGTAPPADVAVGVPM